MQANLQRAVLSGIAQGMQPPQYRMGYPQQYSGGQMMSPYYGGGNHMMMPSQQYGGYPPVYGSSGMRPYNYSTSYEGGVRRAMDQIDATYYQRQRR